MFVFTGVLYNYSLVSFAVDTWLSIEVCANRTSVELFPPCVTTVSRNASRIGWPEAVTLSRDSLKDKRWELTERSYLCFLIYTALFL